jgi:hypothetical protein
LDVQAALSALRGRYAEVRAALAARTGDAALPADVAASIDRLDPMPVLAPLLPRVDRVKALAAAKASQFGAMTAPLETVFGALGPLLNLLHILLSPLAILRDLMLAPLQGLFPGQSFAGPKEILLHFLDEFDPSQLRPDLEPLLNALHDKVRALVDDAVLNPIGEALHTLKSATDLLNIHSLVDAVTGVFQDFENVINSFNPAPLIQEIDAEYQQIISILDQLDPTPFIQEVATLYTDDIIGVLKQVSPESLLLPPLQDLFREISSDLGAFDIQAIFKPILDRLHSMDSDLGDGLHQVEAAWQQMLGVLSSTTGGTASVAVSVTA